MTIALPFAYQGVQVKYMPGTVLVRCAGEPDSEDLAERAGKQALGCC